MKDIPTERLLRNQRLADALYKNNVTRLQALRTDRLSWWAHWGQLAEHFLPRRYKWFVTPNQANRGAQMNQTIIDETGVLAARQLAAGMLTGMTSPTRPWFRLGLKNHVALDFGPARIWLSMCEDILYRIFSESNFYQAMGILWHDLAVFGSASMVEYDDPETVVRFYNQALGEFMFAVNNRLIVDTNYSEQTYTTKMCVDEFGFDNCSVAVQQSYKQGNAGYNREVVIARAIEPNIQIWEGGSNPLGFAVPKHFQYRECFWETSSKETKFLRIRGYHEKPFVGARWDVTSNDPYGRSPGMDGLPATRQLQIEQRRKAEAIDKMVRPPMVAHVSMRNEPSSILPGATNYVADMTNVGYKPAFMVDPRLAEMMEDIKEVQARIQSIFYVDLFLMISQLDTVRSATEIDARREEKLIMLGPVIERSQVEVLDVILDRTFAIAARRGLIPPAPPEVAGADIEVTYVSMLAEAQRAASTAAIERAVGFAGSMAAVKPEILDNLDTDLTFDEYVDKLGLDPKLIVPAKQVAAIRAQRAKQQAAAQQLAVTQAGVEGAKTLSDTKLGSGQSALDRIIGG